jgi:hypothetical protein
VLLLGLDGLWGGAGWEKVRHEAAEDDSEFHSVGGRWARWSGLKAGPGEHEQWRLTTALASSFIYQAGSPTASHSQRVCLPCVQFRPSDDVGGRPAWALRTMRCVHGLARARVRMHWRDSSHPLLELIQKCR